MGIRLIATDVDGTLVDSQGKISSRTLDVLQAWLKRGHLILATGRVFSGIESLCRTLNLKDDQITINGAVVGNPLGHRDLRVTAALGAGNVRRLVGILRDLRISFHYCILEEMVYTKGDLGPADIEALRRFGQPPPRLVGEEVYGKALKIVARISNGDSDRQRRLQAQLAASHLSITGVQGHPEYREFLSPDVSKGRALADILSEMAISSTDVLAFGDSDTDCELMHLAGRSVAVANALPAVKALADEITTSNDEDGVAVRISRLLDEA
jgi:Cof subfamily protein (haloacid dehalogenase superfamily)